MKHNTVARQYAETLFALGAREGRVEEYAEALSTVARLLETEPSFRLFLETPRIDDAEKKALVKRSLEGALPKHVINFVLVTIDKRRQRLLRQIAAEYSALLDEHMGREHVEVTVARPLDAEAETMVTERLTALLGRKAIPHVRVDPDILGGLVVRTGETIYDGSVRRRLEGMRGRMLKADLSAIPAEGAR